MTADQTRDEREALVGERLSDQERRTFWQAVCEWNDVPDAFDRYSPSNEILYAAVERIAAARAEAAEARVDVWRDQNERLAEALTEATEKRRAAEAEVAALRQRLAAALCAAHQGKSPTRQPCAACSQEALTDPKPLLAEVRAGAHGSCVRRLESGWVHYECGVSVPQGAWPGGVYAEHVRRAEAQRHREGDGS